VTETEAFTSVILPVWKRDFVGITKDEAHIPKLRFHGGWYIRRNVSRGLKSWRENES
jgi:hypothetical protein